jgi:hypothetical protein
MVARGGALSDMWASPVARPIFASLIFNNPNLGCRYLLHYRLRILYLGILLPSGNLDTSHPDTEGENSALRRIIGCSTRHWKRNIQLSKPLPRSVYSDHIVSSAIIRQGKDRKVAAISLMAYWAN